MWCLEILAAAAATVVVLLECARFCSRPTAADSSKLPTTNGSTQPAGQTGHSSRIGTAAAAAAAAAQDSGLQKAGTRTEGALTYAAAAVSAATEALPQLLTHSRQASRTLLALLVAALLLLLMKMVVLLYRHTAKTDRLSYDGRGTMSSQYRTSSTTVQRQAHRERSTHTFSQPARRQTHICMHTRAPTSKE